MDGNMKFSTQGLIYIPHASGIFLEKVRKMRKNAVTIAGLQAEI
jgi:hypothetical protein